MKEEKNLFEHSWLKIAATIVVLIVSGVGAVVLERMGSLQQELGSLSHSVNRVSELDEIKERLVKLEVSDGGALPHAQLSSAVSQYPSSEGEPIQLEIVDSIASIDFDPRKSKSKIKITEKGEYLFLIAPQVQRLGGETGAVCMDVWLRINGDDLNNSSVRQCWSSDTSWETTTVLMLQATLPMEPGEVIQIMVRSTPAKKSGAVAIDPEDIPLIPSAIVTILKVG